MTEPLQIIGNYHLLELLGNGTYGQVFRATHRFLAKREVAVKIMRNMHWFDEQRQKRFLAEATILEKLQHPHILPILDAGIADGTPYLVTAYVSGGSLRQRLQDKSLSSPIAALRVLTQLASALQFAHDQQIIHRDLKPENVLFTSRGDVVLADFGLATVLGELSSIDGAVTGTPLYMAPEQFAGTGARESDQYSLGCLAYEMLAGERAFDSLDYFKLAYLHRNVLPKPPREVNPALPEPLAQAIMTAMAKDRKQRFPDVRTFRLFFRPDRALWIQEGQRLIQQNRYPAALEVWDEVIRLDPDNVTIHNVKGQTLQRIQRYTEALACFDRAILLKPDFAVAYSNKATCLCYLQRYQEALVCCQQALRLSPQEAHLHSEKAQVLYYLKRYEDALDSYNQAIHFDDKLANIYAKRAECLCDLERYEEAWQDTELALQRDANLIAAYAVQGQIHYKHQHYQEALSLYAQAQKIEPDSPVIYYQKGLTLHAIGRHIEAVACCDYALRLSPNDPRAISAYNQVVNAYRTAEVTTLPPG